MLAHADPVQELAWTLIHFLWQGALIGAAYAVARCVTHAPRWRLMFGQVALLAMAMAPPVTFLSLLGLLAPQPAAGLGVVGAAAPLLAELPDGGSGPTSSVLTVLVAFWAAGVLLLLRRTAARWVEIRRVCRSALPAPTELQALVELLAHQLRLARPVALRLCHRVGAPVLVGFWRPVILLPMALATRLPAAQLELLLAHELAHVKRWDFLANLLQTAIEILLFYHPLVHWVSARVREDREVCCDDLVTARFGCPVPYARALLAAAEFAQDRTPPLALAATGGVLLPRIERLLGQQQRRLRRTHDAAMPALGAVLVLAFALLLRMPAGIEAPSIAPVSRDPGFAAMPLLDTVLTMTTLLAPMAAPLAPEFEAATIRPEPKPLPIAGPGIPAHPAPRFDQPRLPRIHAPTVAPSSLESSAAPVAQSAWPAVLRYQAPAYPSSAQARGLEGDVVLAFRIRPDGRVADIELLSVEPPGESSLVNAARQALRGWRFERTPDGVAQQRRSFQFRLADADVTPRCLVDTGSRLCRAQD